MKESYESNQLIKNKENYWEKARIFTIDVVRETKLIVIGKISNQTFLIKLKENTKMRG